jgi:hypothetical protein
MNANDDGVPGATCIIHDGRLDGRSPTITKSVLGDCDRPERSRTRSTPSDMCTTNPMGPSSYE